MEDEVMKRAFLHKSKIKHEKYFMRVLSKVLELKILFSVLVLSFAALTVKAYNPHHYNHSELNIRLSDGGVFNISIDNRSFNHYQTHYTIPQLRPGRHYVRIVRYEEFYNGHTYTYHRPRVVFSAYINVPARMRIFSYINYRSRYIVESQTPLHQGPGHGGGYGPGYGHDYGDHYYNVMSQQAFSYLKSTIANTGFDSSKLDIAKQAVRTNRVTSMQVYELMLLLSFESKRLELAKYAYANTVDKESYYVVTRAFSFSSSIRKLNEYIGYAH